MRGKTPAVSVLICTYDRLPSLKRAVSAALAQTFRDLEVVVVDDASRDGTAEWGRTPPARVRYERLESNVGPAGARNRALALARGRFAAFLDSDDVWAPGHLETLLPCFSDRRVRAAFTNYDIVDGRGRVLRRSAFEPASDLHPPFREMTGLGCVPLTSATMARTADLRRIGGFDAGFRRFYDDADLFYRLARRGGGAAFHFVDRPTVYYRRQKKQLSSTLPRRTTGQYVGRALSEWNRLPQVERDFFFDWLHFKRKHQP